MFPSNRPTSFALWWSTFDGKSAKFKMNWSSTHSCSLDRGPSLPRFLLHASSWKKCSRQVFAVTALFLAIRKLPSIKNSSGYSPVCPRLATFWNAATLGFPQSRTRLKERQQSRTFAALFTRGLTTVNFLLMPEAAEKSSWLNRTVLGVGLTSLFSDWSHETASAVLPAFLALIGAGPAWLGVIEGVADGLSSFTKLAAGHFTDRLKSMKPPRLPGYAVTAFATASFGLAGSAAEVMLGRTLAWFGRGVRSPAKKALLAADVPPGAYGRAFGFERLMDTVGAIAGPLTALWLLEKTQHS